MAGIIIVAILLLWIVVLFIRGALFLPEKKQGMKAEAINVNRDKIIEDMSALIQCKTISDRDAAKIDEAEFEKFRQEIKNRFPKVHSACKLEYIGKNGLLYYLEGDEHDKPSVCMAHYDVVPVEESSWDQPAFSGKIENDYIWGRGTLDTKGTLCGILEAAEQLLIEGFKPKQDLYFSFSGEEEIDGNTCGDIVTYLQNKGIRPAFVLDEGGAIVSKVFPGVSRECALIGVGEKGSVNLEFSMESKGGHASTPPVHTILGQLSQAVVNIEKHPFKSQMTRPVLEMFNTLGPHSSFAYRVLFANLWCFKPVLDLICKLSGGELNAMMRTTCAVTKMQGSAAFNVLPPKASFGINMRLLGHDSIDSAKSYLQKVIKNDEISIHVVNGMNPSIYSDTKCSQYHMLEDVILESWPDILVSPYLMMACSDSRHYCRITDNVYRFSAMRLSKEERGMIHGHNERIPINTLLQTVEFYIRLFKRI